MSELSPWHLAIVLLAFAVLFGAKRLPDAARGLGRSLRIFKAEMHSAGEDRPADSGSTAPSLPAGKQGIGPTVAPAAPTEHSAHTNPTG